LPFIRSLIADLKSREGTLVGICSDLDLKRIQENIQQLSEDLETIQNDDLFGPGNFNVDDFCLESRFAQEDLSPITLGDDDLDLKTKPSNDLLDYNGNDSDLDNSESGVSSMESLESLLRKSETHDTPEVPDQINENDEENNEEGSLGKAQDSVEQVSTPTEHEKDVVDKCISDKNVVSIPVLILTDENGVVYSDRTDAGITSDGEPLTDSNDTTEEVVVRETSEDISRVKQVDNTEDIADEIEAKTSGDNDDNVDQSRDPALEREVESNIAKLPEENNIENDTPTSKQVATVNEMADQEPLDSSNNHEQGSNFSENLTDPEKPIVDDNISIESSSHQSIVNSVPDDHGQADSSEQSKPTLDDNTKEAIDATISLDNSRVNTSSDIDDESLARLNYIPLKSEYVITNNIIPSGLEVTNIERTASPANSQVSMEVQLSDDGLSPSDDLPESNLISLLNKEDNSNGGISEETQLIENYENSQHLVNGVLEDDSSEILSGLRSKPSRKHTESPPAPQRVVSSVIQGSDSYQSPYFQEALERLRELNNEEVPLKEGMSLNVFVVEVEKLLEKLRVIEDMMKACQGVPDNVKDELARHVVCTQYVKSSNYSIIFDIILIECLRFIYYFFCLDVIMFLFSSFLFSYFRKCYFVLYSIV